MTDPRGPTWRKTYGTGHNCGFPGCQEKVVGRLWACKPHWLTLPTAIRDRLMQATTTPGPRHSRIRGPAFPVAEAEALLWIEQNYGNEEESTSEKESSAA